MHTKHLVYFMAMESLPEKVPRVGEGGGIQWRGAMSFILDASL